ncbi:hypothetical protein Mcate_01672 [Meiothermus taiwanensis]|uniref:Uncharacterized protein n=1 Tax=Meiothermus taiwanensis TaxID=172827 RepID=A0A399E3C0_9DEIN|nr:hypothetical protein Mcate_01672 [Meiothermus taiwanensis]
MGRGGLQGQPNLWIDFEAHLLGLVGQEFHNRGPLDAGPTQLGHEGVGARRQAQTGPALFKCHGLFVYCERQVEGLFALRQHQHRLEFQGRRGRSGGAC